MQLQDTGVAEGQKEITAAQTNSQEDSKSTKSGFEEASGSGSEARDIALEEWYLNDIRKHLEELASSLSSSGFSLKEGQFAVEFSEREGKEEVNLKSKL